jgi:hypothetical protein
MGEGRWASRARGLGRGRGTRGRGRVHGGEIVGKRLETTDRWGRRDRERRAGELAPTGLAHVTERERHDRVGADRRDPPVRQRGHTGARGGWAKWAGLG